MKKVMVILLLIFASIIGAFFSFIFLISTALNGGEMTSLMSYASTVNGFAFFASIIFLLLAFFYKPKRKSFYGWTALILGLTFLLPMYSYHEVNYLFLIPLGVYFLSGLIVFNQKDL